METVRSFENKNIVISVIDLYEEGGEYITTYWNKNACLVEDRDVYPSETLGGAISKAYDLLVEHLVKTDQGVSDEN